MKLLFCAKCFELVQLRNDLRGCHCGNAIGRYLDDNLTVEVAIKDMTKVRLIGINGHFLNCVDSHDPMEDGGYFAAQNSNITIIPWYSGDKDVVYADWDEMHTTWIDNTRIELFGELTNVDVAKEKILEALDSGATNDYEMSLAVGCNLSHLMKIIHVFNADCITEP